MPKGTTYGTREEGFGEAIADKFIEKGLGGGGSGGTTGGATAIKQDEQTTVLNTISNSANTTNSSLSAIGGAIGGTDSTSATSDTGSWNLNALLKRLLQRITFFTTLFMPAATETEYIGTSAGANLKPSAGNIYAITASNNNSNIRYFQIFNKNSNPVAGDIPVRVFPIPGSDSLFLLGQDVIGGNGIALSSGVTWGFSTTRLNYTAATASECIVTVRWA